MGKKKNKGKARDHWLLDILFYFPDWIFALLRSAVRGIMRFWH